MAEPDHVGDANERWDAIERELSDAAAQVRERASANAVARRADQQVTAIEAELSKAVERARLEENDVDELERVTSRSILAVLKRSRGTDLEREQAELDAAKSLASELAAKRDELLSARATANARLRSYGQVDVRLANAYAAKEQLLRDAGGPAGERLGQVAVDRGRLASEAKELREAIAAGRSALAAMEPLMKELGSSANWSDIDVFLGGGVITSMIKHDHMDAAAEASRAVDRLLMAFRRELGDVRMTAMAEPLDLSPGTRFVDTWFDNIFTDLSVRSRIKESRGQAEHIRATVRLAVDTCSQRLLAVTERISALEAERKTLLAVPIEVSA